MRLPTVTGLEPPGPGRAVFQTMFLSLDHSTGKFFSELVPSPCGPRNWAQSAPIEMYAPSAHRQPRMHRWFNMKSPPIKANFKVGRTRSKRRRQSRFYRTGKRLPGGFLFGEGKSAMI